MQAQVLHQRLVTAADSHVRAEYHAREEAGIMGEGNSVELLDEMFIAMCAVIDLCTSCVDRLVRLLISQTSSTVSVCVQDLLRLNR